MESCIFAFGSLLTLCFLKCNAANSNLFREYIGAESDSVKFTDVPINTSAEFHFILAFAIDYSRGKSPSPTNGNFNIFWETKHLGPSDVASIKSSHHNVKVALSLGGDTVAKHQYAYFQPNTISSWVSNAASSLTQIINLYNLDGIDIDYEHFHAHDDPETFTECIGQLVTTLKKKRIISFASIAPFDDGGLVKNHYLALWSKYGNIFDYVNFQFYAYNNGTSIQQFLGYIDDQTSNYKGGKVLASFNSEASGGLGPKDGFFEACKQLKKEGKLEGIFVWCADGSKKTGFLFEEQAQELLVSA